MKPTRTTGVLLAGILVLSMAGSAAAQTRVGGLNIEGGVEAGTWFFIDEPLKEERAKFEEYRDMSFGPFLQGLRLRFFTDDEGYSTEFLGSKWGREDQEFSLRTGRTGLWRFEFDWDQTLHTFSTTARTPAHEVARGDWRLPGLGSLRDFNTSRKLDDVSVRWDTARIGLTLTPTPDLDLTARYTRIRKDGDRPFSMSFSSPFSGANFIELLEPIEQTVHDFRLGAAYVSEKWQIQVGYALSIFENDLSRVRFDNPCFQGPIGGGAAFGCTAGESRTAALNVVPERGQSSLPPDNMAHTVNLAGAVSLPLRTRVTANLAYSLWLQNDDFLPMTINPSVAALPALQLPQNSLNGIASTTLVNVGLTSRPFPVPLSLSTKYRMYNHTDNSDTITFPSRIVSDRPLAGLLLTAGRRAEREEFTRNNLDADARYQVIRAVATTLGVGWERWNRGPERQARESDEYFGKAAVDAEFAEWVTARLTYKPSFRRSNYHPHIGDFPVFTRQFDQAWRDRQRVDLLLQLTPLDTLAITPTVGWLHDDYVRTNFGLNRETIWSAGFDVGWNPVERVSFSAGFMHEEADRDLTSRATAALVNTDWLSNMKDQTDSVHLGSKVGLIKNVLDWTVNAYYAVSNGTIETRNPNATAGGPALAAGALAMRFPDFTDENVRLDTALRYRLSKSWTASLFYAFEMFSKNDWRTDTLQPFNENLAGTTGSIYLGSDAKDYTAHIVGVMLGYTFGK